MSSGNAGNGTGEKAVSPNWELDRFWPQVMGTFYNFCYESLLLWNDLSFSCFLRNISMLGGEVECLVINKTFNFLLILFLNRPMDAI